MPQIILITVFRAKWIISIKCLIQPTNVTATLLLSAHFRCPTKIDKIEIQTERILHTKIINTIIPYPFERTHITLLIVFHLVHQTVLQSAVCVVTVSIAQSHIQIFLLEIKSV